MRFENSPLFWVCQVQKYFMAIWAWKEDREHFEHNKNTLNQTPLVNNVEKIPIIKQI